MPDIDEQEIKVETTITPTETASEYEAEKVEVIIDRAETAVAIIEQTANIAVAEAVLNAEEKIAEHENTVKHLEYDQEWLQNQLTQIAANQEQIAERLTILELQQLTPQQSEQEQIPPTVEVVTEAWNGSGGEGDPHAPTPTPAETPAEALEIITDKVKRKIRVL